MFKGYEIGKTASVLLCTVLFSATCVLSAVGPAGAAGAVAVTAAHSSPVVAPLA
ncbi:hypothetical protein [Sphingomonas flavalba]|uniref:hypothetical protein n=1 Tax=Sphingomonas flavalba TaxID=2559804 RepID=UPI0014470DC4|nr:hypothetical protein [Sphingomonas flavalba]